MLRRPPREICELQSNGQTTKNMKKQYIKPEILAYEVKSQQLLAGSNPEAFGLGSTPSDYNDDMW